MPARNFVSDRAGSLAPTQHASRNRTARGIIYLYNEGFCPYTEAMIKDLTSAEVAERFGVLPRTARLWCTRGLFPHARTENTPRGPVWLIPEGDLKTFQPPKRSGRPPKTKAETMRDEAEKSVAKKRIRRKDPTRLLKTLS